MKIYDVSAELDREFGPIGSESRKEAEKLAWEEYNVQVLLDARKNLDSRNQSLLKKLVQTKAM